MLFVQKCKETIPPGDPFRSNMMERQKNKKEWMSIELIDDVESTKDEQIIEKCSDTFQKFFQLYAPVIDETLEEMIKRN